MSKINLKDIQSRIVKPSAIPYAKSNKVNLKDLVRSGRIRKGKRKRPAYSFPKLATYDTAEEIQFMNSILRMRVITNAHKGIIVDLGNEELFLRLSQINQLKLIIGLLQSGIDVTIDEYCEEANDKNIQEIKDELNKLEVIENNRQLQKVATLEKLMWVRYGNKGNRDPIQKQKELDEFNKQIQAVRKEKGLV